MTEIQDKLQKKFADSILEIKSPRPSRIYMRIRPGMIKDVIRYAMKDLGLLHFSTITGVDKGTEFEAIYNLFGNKTGLSIGIRVNRDDPKIETVTDIVPGAVCYERELQDFFGFVVKDIPDGRRLIIPDKWPEGQFPLRKDWNQDMLPASFNDGLRRDWRK